MALPMMTATQTASALAEKTGISRTDVRHVLDELHNLILAELGECNRFKLVGLVQLEPKVMPARKARMGRNPATGAAVQIAAKPATAAVKARVLAEAKNVALDVKQLSAQIENHKAAPRARPKPVVKVKKKVRAKAKNKR
jgi:DNA-binding protein HU-beta